MASASAYEVDPLCCSECGGQMKVVSFIEPPQADVIEKILHGHQSAAMVGGLWRSAAARAPPTSGSGRSHSEPNELTYIE